jgi:hypothetical protein
VAGLLFVMQWTTVQPISAQSPNQIERERLNGVMDANTNVEEFRQELNNYFAEMEGAIRLLTEIPAVRQKFSQAGFQPFGILAQAKQQIASMSSEDLATTRAVYARFPGWREAPRTINSLIKPELRQRLESKIAAAQNGGGFQINAVTPDNCQDGINADISNTDIAAAKTAEIAGEAIEEAFPTDGLTILFRLPSIAARALLQGVVLTLETLKAIKDDCTALSTTDIQSIVTTAKTEIINNDNSNKTTIVANDNTNATTLNANLTNTRNLIIVNDNTNTANIVNNDNANKKMIVDAGNANSTALRDVLLRSQIEADLARGGGDDDESTPVAWYLTPTANGGQLDLVQTIVTQTLANIVSAGGTIGQAQKFLTRANADKSAGRFKDAYSNYRKAYQAAARRPDSDDKSRG